MKLNYIKVGNYLLPNLVTNNQNGAINKYGYLRLNYLKENKKGLYTSLILQDKLTKGVYYIFSIKPQVSSILLFISHFQFPPS